MKALLKIAEETKKDDRSFVSKHKGKLLAGAGLAAGAGAYHQLGGFHYSGGSGNLYYKAKGFNRPGKLNIGKDVPSKSGHKLKSWTKVWGGKNDKKLFSRMKMNK